MNSAPNVTSTEMRGRLTDWNSIRNFVLAGNATFTVRSVKTGTRYTYKVRVPKKGKNPSGVGPYYVSLLNGANNTDDYAYMGVLNVKTMQLVPTFASRMTKEAPSWIALIWFLQRLVQGGAPCTTVEFWHEGNCGRCGRKLTVPESIASGIGPVCNGQMEAV